jgi:predicted component of type VI protein secretion system
MASSAKLIIAQGAQRWETFPLEEPALVIGRDPRNTIVIDHPQVSRRHARITQRDETWVIEDLQSTNGTFVNGERLLRPHALIAGDVIDLGEAMILTFREEQRTRIDAHHPTHTPRVAPADLDASPSQPPPRSPSPPFAAQREPRPYQTWAWLGAGCIILLLVVACSTVLILGYLGLLPSLFYEPLRWLGLL